MSTYKAIVYRDGQEVEVTVEADSPVEAATKIRDDGYFRRGDKIGTPIRT